MRTTVDLPDDLHRIATAIAHDQGRSLSETVSVLLRKAIEGPGDPVNQKSARTGLGVIRLGHTITTEDVRALDDDGA